MENHYLDYLSTKNQISYSNDDLNDLFKNVDIINPILDEIYWLDAVTVFLNKSCNVPQQKIAEMLNMSQLGVSKRVRSSLKKINTILIKPEKSNIKVKKDLQYIIKNEDMEIFLMYYHMGSFSIVSRLLNVKSFRVRFNILDIIDYLRKLLDTNSDIDFLRNVNSNYSTYHKSQLMKDKNHIKKQKIKIKKYYDFLILQINLTNYSTYQCKLYDKDRNKCIEQ